MLRYIDVPDLLVAILMALLPPCPTEDSFNCGFDATSRGNGEGRSFVTLLINAGTEAAVEVVLRGAP